MAYAIAPSGKALGVAAERIATALVTVEVAMVSAQVRDGSTVIGGAGNGRATFLTATDEHGTGLGKRPHDTTPPVRARHSCECGASAVATKQTESALRCSQLAEHTPRFRIEVRPTVAAVPGANLVWR